MPISLVVKKGSNARMRVASSMPTPVSATAIMTYSPGSIRSGSEATCGRVEERVRGFNGELAAARHCVPGVERQIDQRIFELIGVDEGVPKPVAKDRLERDRLPKRSSQQIIEAADQLIGVDGLRGERLAA